MDGWRAVPVVIRMSLVAVLLAGVALFVFPKVAGRGPRPEPIVVEAKAPALRRQEASALLPLVWCRPKQDFSDQALEALQAAAADKDVAAQFALGVAKLRGWGMKCDARAGLELLEVAADRGFAPAEYLLGVMAENGRVVPKSLDNAAALYERAARGGHVLAMRRLAEFLLGGTGVEPDIEAAIGWLETAGHQGDVDCAVNLGLIYRDGASFGFEPKLAEAYYWFSIAAQLGDPGALELKRSVGEDLDLEELDEANHRANTWRAAPKDTQANADFETIIESFAQPTEQTERTEPTTSAAETPAS
jgi:TPR repeat protein